MKMTIQYLRPSQIRYSQDSIAYYFGYGRYCGRPIGETLDDLLGNRCSVDSIPTITVEKVEGLWYTADNRRLWVFRKGQEFGIIDEIPVYIGYISPSKFTTYNSGVSIRVRGDPGGTAWRRRTIYKPLCIEEPEIYNIEIKDKITEEPVQIPDIVALETNVDTLKLTEDAEAPESIDLPETAESQESISDNFVDEIFSNIDSKVRTGSNLSLHQNIVLKQIQEKPTAISIYTTERKLDIKDLAVEHNISGTEDPREDRSVRIPISDDFVGDDSSDVDSKGSTASNLSLHQNSSSRVDGLNNPTFQSDEMTESYPPSVYVDMEDVSGDRTLEQNSINVDERSIHQVPRPENLEQVSKLVGVGRYICRYKYCFGIILFVVILLIAALITGLILA